MSTSDQADMHRESVEEENFVIAHWNDWTIKERITRCLIQARNTLSIRDTTAAVPLAIFYFHAYSELVRKEGCSDNDT